MTYRGVFVFADDGLQFFPTQEDAAGYMEWVDMEAGNVYEALFTVEGERLVPRQLDVHRARLQPTSEIDIKSLRSLLRREREERAAFKGDPDDPAAAAREMQEAQMASERSRRWPRWPRWLDERLHGSSPPNA